MEERVEVALLLIAAPEMKAPLVFRWKGMDVANAKTERARKTHKLWDRALRKMYPKAKVAAAAKSFEDISMRLLEQAEEPMSAAVESKMITLKNKSVVGQW